MLAYYTGANTEKLQSCSSQGIIRALCVPCELCLRVEHHAQLWSCGVESCVTLLGDD